ncbi:MAG TPA: MBL fold metallo-hydrolase, partial [Verrucomicrobiales bacterium]|nr:MBL fold metallo-hydrolase [Verrucomicrobiales bacterium]
AMLHNSVNVMSAKREELGILDYPYFTHRELDVLERVLERRALERPFTVGGMTCRFHDAGHIMGSVGLHLEIPGHSVFYTGDVNFEDQSVSRSASFPRDHVDTLILEATRGAVERPSGFSRQGEIDRLGEWIRRVLSRGGSVLIPVFAVGKTQEILVTLHRLRRFGRIPSCPVFIGGLSTKMTSIVDRFADRVPRQETGLRILDAMDLQITSRRRGGELRYSPGCVYALSSGMMSENTVSNRFAHQFLDNPRNAVLFVGYTDPESPAGLIRRAGKGDLLQLDARQEPVALQCDVETFDFSGHATREDLVRFAREVDPDRILLVHGDDDAVEWLRTALIQELPRAEVSAPAPGQSVSLA